MPKCDATILSIHLNCIKRFFGKHVWHWSKPLIIFVYKKKLISSCIILLTFEQRGGVLLFWGACAIINPYNMRWTRTKFYCIAVLRLLQQKVNDYKWIYKTFVCIYKPTYIMYLLLYKSKIELYIVETNKVSLERDWMINEIKQNFRIQELV